MRYEYAAQGDHPAIRLTWYDGDKIPPNIKNVPTGGGGNLFIGDKGMLRADYDTYKLYPEADFAGFKPPAPTIPNSIGHHKEWLQACKTGSPTTCNFGYSGPLTEAVLLGNVAFRTGQKLEWDALALKASNSAADAFIHKEYRKGWELVT